MPCHVNAPLITLRDVAMRYERKIILSDINLEICRGDFLAITGPNGGGKTTLLRIILRLLDPTHGTVDYHFPKDDSSRQRIGYLPQKNMIDSHFPVTVEEAVGFGLMCDKTLTKSQRHDKISETLELLGLQSHRSYPIGEISGGQLQRTLIGRAIISQPELLVMDEPLSYLDKDYEHRLYEIIENLSKTTTIVLVSHEMSTIAGMANRHLIVNRTIHECHAEHHYVSTSCE